MSTVLRCDRCGREAAGGGPVVQDSLRAVFPTGVRSYDLCGFCLDDLKIFLGPLPRWQTGGAK